MKAFIPTLGLATLATMLLIAVPVMAAEVTAAEEGMATKWAQNVDTDKDHLVSKSEVIAIVEKAFAAADAKKTGKLDMKQLAVMLREFDPRATGERRRDAKP